MTISGTAWTCGRKPDERDPDRDRAASTAEENGGAKRGKQQQSLQEANGVMDVRSNRLAGLPTEIGALGRLEEIDAQAKEAEWGNEKEGREKERARKQNIAEQRDDRREKDVGENSLAELPTEIGQLSRLGIL